MSGFMVAGTDFHTGRRRVEWFDDLAAALAHVQTLRWLGASRLVIYDTDEPYANSQQREEG